MQMCESTKSFMQIMPANSRNFGKADLETDALNSLATSFPENDRSAGILSSRIIMLKERDMAVA